MNMQPYTLNLQKLGIKINKDINRKMYLPMFTLHKAGSTHGSGLFAARYIRKNEEIIRVTGPTVNEEIEDVLYASYGIDVMVQIGIQRWVLPNNEVRFINHSCDPNMGFRGSRVFVAMRDIAKGEELTFDYAMNEIDDSKHIWTIDCLCKSPNCRKIISSVDIFNKDFNLVKKYKSYIPAFVLHKIKQKI